jgi:CheY-like chemotaxis protein
VAFILLVEDHQDSRDMYVLALERAKHVVATAADGGEATRALGAVRPDIVITDIFMPMMNGIELVRAARARFPNVKVIAISGGWQYEARDVLAAAKQTGADLVLRKPLPPATLVEAVAALVAAGAADFRDIA